MKRNIFDLSVNKYGSQIAIVENQGGYESVQESAVRIYSVGRKKNLEDEAVCVLRLFVVFAFRFSFDSHFTNPLQEEEDDDMAVSDEASISDDGSVGEFFVDSKIEYRKH